MSRFDQLGDVRSIDGAIFDPPFFLRGRRNSSTCSSIRPTWDCQRTLHGQRSAGSLLYVLESIPLITTGLSIDNDDSGTVYFGFTSKYESLVPHLASSTNMKPQSALGGQQ